MSVRFELTSDLAREVLHRMGSTGQPPDRGALFVNVGTDQLLDVMQSEYLGPVSRSRRNSTFKLVQAPFGGGKSQFLSALRELAWQDGFITASVGLSPQECPFDKPTKIFQEVAIRIELPPEDLEEETAPGIENVLRQIALARIEEHGKDAFLDWLAKDFRRTTIESRAFGRAVEAFLRAVAEDDLEATETLTDYLLGDSVPSAELDRYRLRDRLNDAVAFRWLRSLVQCLAAMDMPGVVFLFDEMDRNMSFSPKRRREIGDNLRQMIDYCGQSWLPGVIWCYAVPPEFMTTIVPEYPALAQRLKGPSAFSDLSPQQPVIDLDHLAMGPTELMKALGGRLIELTIAAYGNEALDPALQRRNVDALARELGESQLESGTRRTFVKAAISLLETQRRGDQSELDEADIRSLARSNRDTPFEPMAGELEI